MAAIGSLIGIGSSTAAAGSGAAAAGSATAAAAGSAASAGAFSGLSVFGPAGAASFVTPGAAAGAGAAGAAAAGATGASLLGTLETVGTIAGLGSSVLAGFGQAAAANQQAAALEFQAQQARLQAKQEEIRALERSNAMRRKLLEDLGTADATFAARGISLSSGTAQSARDESIRAANRDVTRSQDTGVFRSAVQRMQASQFSQAAGAARRSGTTAAIGTIGTGLLRTIDRL